MANAWQHLTTVQAIERGLICKKDLQAIGLMPGSATRKTATVWQGRGACSIYASSERVLFVRQPSPALLRRREVVR